MPAIAHVGHIVEPEVAAAGRVVELLLRWSGERLDEPGIRMASENVRNRDLVARLHEHPRVVPSDHGASPNLWGVGHQALRVSNGGWLTTERVASQPARQT